MLSSFKGEEKMKSKEKRKKVEIEKLKATLQISYSS